MVTRCLLFLFIFASAVQAQFLPHRRLHFQPVAVVGGGGNLADETFEGANSGYDLVGWSAGGDLNPDPDYLTSPAPLDGAQSLRVVVTAQTSRTRYTITAAGEVWMKLHFRIISKTGNCRLFSFLDSGNSAVAFSEFDTSNTVPLFNWYEAGANHNATPSDTVSVGTTYYAWVHYKKGSGVNCIVDVEFSASNSRTGSGTKYAQITNGTATGDVTVVQLGTSNAETYNAIIDNVSVSITGFPTP